MCVKLELLLYYKNNINYFCRYVDYCNNIDKENNKVKVFIELCNKKEIIAREELKYAKIV